MFEYDAIPSSTAGDPGDRTAWAVDALAVLRSAGFEARVLDLTAEFQRAEAARRALPDWPEPGSPWTGHYAGPALAGAVLERLREPELTALEVLDCVDALDRSIAALQGYKAEAVARFTDLEARSTRTGHRDGMKSAQAQLVLLRLGPTAAESLVGRATALQSLPKTLAALKAGAISENSAHALAAETALLERAQKEAIENRVVPGASTQSTAQIRRAARVAIAELDPELLRRRHAAERKRRSVSLAGCPFGMSRLTAYLPADVAGAMYGVIRKLARTFPARDEHGDRVDFDARKADALRDLVLNPPRRPKPRVSVQVRVVVPMGTLLGASDEAGHLAGYGPIPAGIARDLAADATWRRLLTDPTDGAILDYGTTRYRPTAPLFERVRAQAADCDSPGCVMAAQDCDLDHRVPFRADGTGGGTSEDELDPRCQHHHDVKGLPGWRVHRNRDGSSTWTTPHGKSYRTSPRGFVPRRC